MTAQITDIIEALRKLGAAGYICIKGNGSMVCDVFINGKHFGLWDKIKKTFVE